MKVPQNLKVTWQNVPTQTIAAGGVVFAWCSATRAQRLWSSSVDTSK